MADSRPLALITGASSGIGAAFARKLAAQGFDLVLVARHQERLEELARELGNSEVLAADLTDDSDLQRVEQRIATAPNLELLVNNAGFGTRGLFAESDLAGQDKMHRLHVLATMRLSHTALAGMMARGKGGLINVSSVAGFWQSPGTVSYCATKAWMNCFTEGLYMEAKAAGSPVRVQALCPGFTITGFHDALPGMRQEISAGLWMKAEDVVDASLAGLAENKLFVVPGWKYKVTVFLLRWMPRFVRHAVAARYRKKLRAR
jgi:short-subunit dehydrogenase